MSRAARIILDNAIYHINTRGNQKQKVFRQDSDYEKFIQLVVKYKRRFKFKLYGFCLMPNHVHLIIMVAEQEVLKKIMLGLNLSYTIYFNSRYKIVGHLWQGRFKSKVIEDEKYLLDCINYVENNPVRAGIVKSAAEYRWSSYRFRIENHPLVDDIMSEND